jgi:iron(III) transport system substrate-binding protein
LFASYRVYLCIMAYNTSLVKAADAPKSFHDLLDPKWAGKIVKAHPSYSGTILTATYQVSRDIGWDYFEKLAKQKIMQVQSAADPPKKLALGERAIMADGIEYGIFQLKESGRPVEPIYATEGSPLIIGPNGIFKSSPNPNAAKLFQSFALGREAQQLIIDVGGLRSVHPETKEKEGRKPLKDIKTMKDDAAAVEQQSAAIKSRYSKIFHV